MILQNLDETVLSLVGEYTVAFHRAEEALKTAEQTIIFLPSVSNSDNGGLFDPAINELRYAGKHIVDFIEKGETDFIEKAISHCLRAEHDAYDCLIQFLLSECRDFQNDYANVSISGVLADYPKMIKEIYQISRSPITRDQANAETLAQKKSQCEQLADICSTLFASRDELNKLVDAKRREEIREQKGFWRTFVISLVGAIVGAVATFVLSRFIQ